MNKIVQTVLDGATYAGAAGHTILNYALIAITVLPYMAPGRLTGRRAPLWAFIASAFVQVVFWFTLDATGVSVVWCSMAGFSLVVFIKGKPFISSTKGRLLIWSLVAALAGIIYYAITLPPITTIAHVAAVVMGTGLYYAGNRPVRSKAV